MRITLHADRRRKSITGARAYVLVIDGRPMAAGERASMVDLLSELEESPIADTYNSQLSVTPIIGKWNSSQY